MDWWTILEFDAYSFSVMLQVFHNCVLVVIHGLEAHLVSQEDPEEEEEEDEERHKTAVKGKF